MVARGTGPDEVIHGRDSLIAAIAQAGPSVAVVSENVEAWADGDLGYVYAENAFTTEDGASVTCRGLAVAHRKDGEWQYLHGLQAIPVPGEMLTADSPLVN
jgi:hypothetical protein